MANDARGEVKRAPRYLITCDLYWPLCPTYCLCHRHNFHLPLGLLCWTLDGDLYQFVSEIKKVLHVYSKWHGVHRGGVQKSFPWHWSDSYQWLTSGRLGFICLYEFPKGVEKISESSSSCCWWGVTNVRSCSVLFHIRRSIILPE